MDDLVPKLLVEHYQKTSELTYRYWTQRNRTFLIMIAVIGVGTLLTYRASEANPILVIWAANALNITDATKIKEFRDGFPFALCQAVLLTAVFYLMVSLYHRSVCVSRSYEYLGLLEGEIRECLSISAGRMGFARESGFYWNDRPWLLDWIKYFYTLLLGVLLIAFIGGRIWSDFRKETWAVVLMDFVISTPILICFGGYAKYSIQSDRTQRAAHTR